MVQHERQGLRKDRLRKNAEVRNTDKRFFPFGIQLVYHKIHLSYLDPLALVFQGSRADLNILESQAGKFLLIFKEQVIDV